MEKRKKVEIPSKKSLVPGAVLLALLAAIIIYAVMIHAETQALQAYEKSTIYVAAKTIPKGMKITEKNMEQYLVMKEMDKSLIPDTALAEPTQAEGLVPQISIAPGTLLTTGMFEEINEITKGMDAPVIAGFRVEDLYQAVGGTLRVGDRIHIYNVNEEGTAELVWSNVYVQEVFDNTGVQIASGDESSPAQRINVYMDKKDIERFYSELAVGTLRVVKVCD